MRKSSSIVVEFLPFFVHTSAPIIIFSNNSNNIDLIMLLHKTNKRYFNSIDIKIILKLLARMFAFWYPFSHAQFALDRSFLSQFFRPSLFIYGSASFDPTPLLSISLHPSHMCLCSFFLTQLAPHKKPTLRLSIREVLS